MVEYSNSICHSGHQCKRHDDVMCKYGGNKFCCDSCEYISAAIAQIN